jgi:hypothetical protein
LSRRYAALVTVAGLLAGATVAGILLARGSKQPTRPLLVDEKLGRIGRVTLGESRESVIATLGAPGARTAGGPFAPLGESLVGIGGPPAIAVPGRPEVLRYDRLAVLLVDGRVFSLLADDPGATTRKGVGVGQPLSAARRADPSIVCRTASGGEASEAYPFCSVRLGDLRLGFGKDPIRSISLTAVR